MPIVCFCNYCGSKLTRENREFQKSVFHFCNHSCAATYFNAQRQKPAPKKCLFPGCGNFVREGRSKYCSRKCADASRRGITKYSPEVVIGKIKEFFNQNKRLPTKRDLSFLYRLARRFYGTWNGAVKAAGFDPNPILFANHFVANDGHRCDSLSEKIVDDWLFARKIPHEVKVKYPWNNGMSADFRIGKFWVELFGLKGQLDSYDHLMTIKLKMIEKFHLKLISVYLDDLFPKNRLEEKIKVLQR